VKSLIQEFNRGLNNEPLGFISRVNIEGARDIEAALYHFAAAFSNAVNRLEDEAD
jgi:hypothetical protein